MNPYKSDHIFEAELVEKPRRFPVYSLMIAGVVLGVAVPSLVVVNAPGHLFAVSAIVEALLIARVLRYWI